MPPLLLATTNPHKLEELRAILAPIHLLSLADVPNAASIPEPVEDGDTFEDNARLKASYYARATNHFCLADDSGLEVDALQGQPGVHSAYYHHGLAAGPSVPRAQRDAANNAKLLHELRNTPPHQRAARFRCVMALAAPNGDILATAQGAFEGVIASTPLGDHGFGYDPLLLLPDGRTSAQLPPHEKNQRSHRANAARAIATQLHALLNQ